MELLDYTEAQGRANFDWQCRANETIRQEANLTLGFLLAGAASSLVWAVPRAGDPAAACALVSAILGLSCWLFFLAHLLCRKCLAPRESMPPANQPLQVYQPQFDVKDLRELQLQHLETAILIAIEKGNERAKWLVRCRNLTFLSPVVFLAVWFLAWLLTLL